MNIIDSIRRFVRGASIARSPDTVFIVANDRGGFGLRQPNSPATHSVGNYPSREAAEDIARLNGYHPIHESTPRPVEQEGALKYVVIEEKNGTERIFFCLAPSTHYEMAQAFGHNGGKPVSAGFVQIRPDGTAKVFGMSTSLGLAARNQDAATITALGRVTLTLGRDSVPTFSRPQYA